MTEIVYGDGVTTLYCGHVIDTLRMLPDESVQMAVTSPPYYGLRAYGTDPVIWGGDPECGHAFVKELLKPQSGGTGAASKKQVTNGGSQEAQAGIMRGGCVNCDAWLGEYGHEPTPRRYIDNTMLILREIRRALKKDGVVFWNVGDSYAGSGRGPSSKNGLTKQHSNMGSFIARSLIAPVRTAGMKPKDLMLIPERFAIAAQDDGWYIRDHIAWVKRNPMPESVRDRCTSSWEYVWMLTKSRTYYWNREGAQEQGVGDVRNMRNAWVLPQHSFKGAHFATFNPEIPRRCISLASKHGDVVLDPFCGSGTTNVVARDLGRKSIGIELQRKYLDEIAIPRLNPFRVEV